jgi:type IV pilus assembly protein PilA
MVVVLIIAILIAIAIPQFLGARSRAQDAGAKSDLRNALTAEKTAFTDNQKYSSDVTATGTLKTIEPSLAWGTAPSVTVGNVTGTDANIVCLQETSKSGSIFAIADVASGTSAGTYYNKGACPATLDTGVKTSFTGW